MASAGSFCQRHLTPKWTASVLAMALLAPLALCAATFQTLRVTGSTSNRLNIVFLSEGYTTAQTNTFQADCTNALNAIFGGGAYVGEEPFVNYSNYFNAYAIFTNSVDAGSDHPYWGTSKNTYFNSSYDTNNDYVITIPPGATGQGRVDALLNSFTPTNQYRYRLPVLLVNDSGLGGVAGGSGGVTTIVGKGQDFQGILTHESSHVLAGLGDEYEADPGGFDYSNLPGEPNTTTNTTFNLIPWKAWIDTNSTPIPTPDVPENSAKVGLFEGAHYSPTNWYRPKSNCRMRSVTTSIPFCEVCREALVKSFYQRIKPWDAVSPASSSVTLVPGQDAAFSVTPLQPASHALSIQWRTNGVNVPAATNTAFMLPASLGLTSVSVVVHDDTAWVRNDPAGVLTATNTWSLSSLWIESAQALSVSQFRFTVRGSGVTNFTVQASTNFTQWTSISTNALSGGAFNFTNNGLSGIPWRFYRAVSPPQ